MIRPQMHDVLVIGDGPAGLALAVQLSRGGMDVGVLSVALRRPWFPTYGAFDDELEGTWVDELVAAQGGRIFRTKWPRSVLYFTEGDSKLLDRTFACIDKALVQKSMLDECDRSGKVTFYKGTARFVEHRADHSIVVAEVDDRSKALTATFVVEATGHFSQFLQYEASAPPPFWQSTYGEIVRTEGPHGLDMGRAIVMDFRVDHLPRELRDEFPSSGYLLPFAEDTLLVQEMMIPLPDRHDLSKIQQRYDHRKRFYGLESARVVAVEQASYPMTGPLPVHGQRLLAIGGAARHVPATGYMLGGLLPRVPAMAAAIAGAARDTGSMDVRAARAWEAIWPEERRKIYRRIAPGRRWRPKTAAQVSGDVRLFFSAPIWKDFWSFDLDRSKIRRNLPHILRTVLRHRLR